MPELRDNDELRKRALVPMADVKMHLPIAVSGYTDFYSSKEHATNVGVMFRGKDNALQPNWLHMPIGYNGARVDRRGQRHQGAAAARAAEAADGGAAELRAVQAARFRARNGRGGRPAVARWARCSTETQAEEMIFGFVILNDWSARDIQQWEYVPLGPFQAKAFAHLDQPVDRDARGAGAVPRPRTGAGPGTAALSAAGTAEQL